MIRIFDLHCDTLSRCLDCGEGLYKNSGQLDGARICGEKVAWVQTFACFIESGCGTFNHRKLSAGQGFICRRDRLCDYMPWRGSVSALSFYAAVV